MVELSDERSFKRALADRVEELQKDQLEAMIDIAIREANRVLIDATPPEGASMEEWHMKPIAESVEKRWDGDKWVAEWTHPHANKIEVGVRPHEIHGDPVLVFEIGGETVFATKVQHPGIPALGYIRRGFRKALREFQELDL
jgi:hypothetical protein